MSKSSKDQMSQDEKKVLSEVVKNANKNIETIAHLCGFSKQKTWRIIKRLESKELIWGYTAIFNEEKMALKHFMLMVKRSMKRLDQQRSIRSSPGSLKILSKKRISQLKAVGMSMGSMTGSSRLLRRIFYRQKSFLIH